MENQIEFKYPHLPKELIKVDGRLLVVFYALVGYVTTNFRKSLIITEIYRDQKTQDSYYKDNPLYKTNPWQSVHQYWRGIDISLYYFTQDEIIEMTSFINQHISYGGGKLTALVHDIGLGSHLHLQVNSEDVTRINK